MDFGNPLREKLASGTPVFGTFIQTATPALVEIAALSGFDFALIDAEHGPMSAETALPMVLAAEAHGLPPIARIGELDKQIILKYLDIGISGVMVPQIADPMQAEDAVAATKFSPRGTRGLAGGRIFEFGLRSSPADLVGPLNDRVLTILQFEHVDTLHHLDDILATPDLDVLFIGPNDLAQSLGYAGQPGHPEVTAVADKVVARAKAAGVYTGTVAPTSAAARSVVSRGFDMIVANSFALLADASRTWIRETKDGTMT